LYNEGVSGAYFTVLKSDDVIKSDDGNTGNPMVSVTHPEAAGELRSSWLVSDVCMGLREE
jgi:hypothetical protein